MDIFIAVRQVALPSEIIHKISMCVAHINMMRIIEQYGINFNDLCQFLIKNNGVITGSFVLHCVDPRCQYNDIDIFINSADTKITSGDFCGARDGYLAYQINEISGATLGIGGIDENIRPTFKFKKDTTSLDNEKNMDEDWVDDKDGDWPDDKDGDWPSTLNFWGDENNGINNEEDNLNRMDKIKQLTNDMGAHHIPFNYPRIPLQIIPPTRSMAERMKQQQLNDALLTASCVLKNPDYVFSVKRHPVYNHSAQKKPQNVCNSHVWKIKWIHKNGTQPVLRIDMVKISKDTTTTVPIALTDPKIILMKYSYIECTNFMFDGNQFYYPTAKIEQFLTVSETKIVSPMNNYFDNLYDPWRTINLWTVYANIHFDPKRVHPAMQCYVDRYKKYFSGSDSGTAAIDFFLLINNDYDLPSYHFFINYIENNQSDIIAEYKIDPVTNLSELFYKISGAFVGAYNQTAPTEFYFDFILKIYQNYRAWYYILKYISKGYNITNLDQFSIDN